MKKIIAAAVFCWLLLVQLGAVELKPVKYVFLFIGDGTSYPQREAANRYLKATNAEPLFIDAMPFHRSTRTAAANNVVTDSAASGTAIACGSKTNKNMLGLAPDGSLLESCATLARKNGRKVGILTSVTLNNATPAAFYGHQDNRHNYYLLGTELVKSGFDYFAGGAVADAMPRSTARPDNIPALKQRIAALEAEIESCRKANARIDAGRQEARKTGDNAKFEAFQKEKKANSTRWKKAHDQLRYANQDLKTAENFVGNIMDYAKQNGFLTISSRSRERISALKPGCGKVIAVGKTLSGPLQWEIDAAGDVQATSLAFLTAKGIELLDNQNGFFMMIEGGKIDWSCHGNDAGTMLREVLGFDDAVKVAADFAKRHPQDTLIVVTGDHETGGLCLPGTPEQLKNLGAQKHSADYFSRKLRQLKKEDGEDKLAKAKALVTECFGLQFDGEGPMTMNADEKMALEGALLRALGEKSAIEVGFYDNAAAAIKAGKNPGAVFLATLLVSRKSGLEWGTQGHTALPVRTSAMGAQAEEFLAPGNLTEEQKKPYYTHDPKIEVPLPEIDNSDIGIRLKQVVAPLQI
ncbi:alkaline phosphatase [uncultured Victivallis sp.]|uniref:alkaline phosphatase n=1 Tax=uncultured Victivallis sp. TaxID=354118 RepID=UPI002584D632|nr:alkaline phosphatase [uncultured Victivallis sp.]